MNPETLRRLGRLQTTYDRMNGQVRDRIKSFLVQSWGALRNYRDADIDRFVQRVIPVVISGERAVLQLTNVYLAQTLSAGTGTTVRSPVVEPESVTGYATRGVEPAEVYRRPAVALYTALSIGHSMTEAVTIGRERLLDLAMTDLQLARTRTVARHPEVRQFRRVLSGAEDCDLCRIAAQQIYYRGDLMPIHPGCDCGVMPVFAGERAPEPAPDADRVVTHEHGEYGPTLAWADQHFTGPTSI